MGIGIPWFPPITLTIDALSLGVNWTVNKIRGDSKNGFPDISELYDNGSIEIINPTGSGYTKIQTGHPKIKKDVTVIINAHGSEKTIKDSLLEVLNQRYPIKNVYISDSNIDNTRDVIEELRSEFPKVHYWSKEGVTGKAEKINHLTRDPNVELGDYVYLMDSATKLAPDVIERLVLDFAKNEDNLAAVTSYGYVTPPKNYLATYFHCGKEWTNRIGKFRKTAQQNRRGVFVVCGASFMVKSDILKDGEIPIGTKTEDTAYTWLLQEKGYKVRVVQDAVVHAEDVSTLGSQLNQTERWYTGTWQNLWLHKGKLFDPRSKGKNLGWTTVLPGLFESTMYTGTILALPAIYFLDPQLVYGFLIGDTILSITSPVIGHALAGKSNLKNVPKELGYTLRHYHQITAYKVMASLLWLYTGAKTAADIATGNSKKWHGEWETLK